MKNDSLKGQHRINEQIRAKEVRIVGDDVESAVYPIAQALKMAEDHEADLVEISPNAVPPVCRIIDYSKFLYQLKKRQKEQKAKQVKVNVKEIRFGPQTDDHDYNFKLKHAIGFLQDGDKVKAYVFFKGRSILFKEQGEVLLLRFANDLEEYAKVEQMPLLEGKRMTISLAPKKAGSPKKAETSSHFLFAQSSFLKSNPVFYSTKIIFNHLWYIFISFRPRFCFCYFFVFYRPIIYIIFI